MSIVERYLPDILDTVISRIDVSDITGVDSLHFDFGNYIEITNKLSKKNKNNLKYPLFALILDVVENEIDGPVYKSYNFNLIIAYHTEKNYTSQQRLENIFKPILQPLYRKLIDEIKRNYDNYFIITGDYVDHTKYDRYFLGSESPNQNKLNDYIDAIEIEFRNIRVTNDYTC